MNGWGRIGAGVVVLGFAAFFAWAAVGTPSTETARAEATVIALVTRRAGPHGELFQFPRVRFRTNEGHEVEALSELGELPSSFRVGQRITVAYDPRDPRKVDTAPAGGFLLRTFAPVLIVVIAACSCAALALLWSGAGWLWRERRAYRDGVLVWGTFLDYHRDPALEPGEQPARWVPLVEWHDPKGYRHVFEGEPAAEQAQVMRGDRVPVRVLLSDPARYHWVNLEGAVPAGTQVA